MIDNKKKKPQTHLTKKINLIQFHLLQLHFKKINF